MVTLGQWARAWGVGLGDATGKGCRSRRASGLNLGGATRKEPPTDAARIVSRVALRARTMGRLSVLRFRSWLTWLRWENGLGSGRRCSWWTWLRSGPERCICLRPLRSWLCDARSWRFWRGAVPRRLQECRGPSWLLWRTWSH